MGRDKPGPVHLKHPNCDLKDCKWRPYCLYPATPCRAESDSTDASAESGADSQAPGTMERGGPHRQGEACFDFRLRDADLEVCIFRSCMDPAAFQPARMICCRAGEVEFLSARQFEEDRPVYIRITQPSEIGICGEQPEDFRSAGVARVKRCRLAGYEERTLYRVVAEYY